MGGVTKIYYCCWLCVCVVQEHTKGDYQKALLSLCGGDDWCLTALDSQKAVGLEISADCRSSFSFWAVLFRYRRVKQIMSPTASVCEIKTFHPFQRLCAVWSNDHQRAAETHCDLAGAPPTGGMNQSAWQPGDTHKHGLTVIVKHLN